MTCFASLQSVSVDCSIATLERSVHCGLRPLAKVSTFRYSPTTRSRKPVRIVLDTNILASALIHGDGPPGRVLAAVKHDGVTPITSAAQLHELRDVVSRAQLGRYIRREEAEDLIRNLEAVADVVAADLPDVDASPDPDDNFILGTAIAGRADMIISGDKKHMLSLGHVDGVPIITAADALDRLHGGNGP